MMNDAGNRFAGRRAQRVILRIDIATGLPEIVADQGQIERVVTNLVTNAIRATGPGGEIEVAAALRSGVRRNLRE